MHAVTLRLLQYLQLIENIHNILCKQSTSYTLDQGFHKLFAYGCPDRGREFDKRKDKELLKRSYNICN